MFQRHTSLSLAMLFILASAGCGSEPIETTKHSPPDADTNNAYTTDPNTYDQGTNPADTESEKIQVKTHLRVKPNATTSPTGLSPSQIKTVYNLPTTGGIGTVAIIDAYDDPTAEKDLNVYSTMYGLPSCTTANGCFEKHKMSSRISTNAGWALEIALDTQVVHGIAPYAKILLVEARTNSGNDLLAAVNYARLRSDVVAISMSWGSPEFSGSPTYDSYFTSTYGAKFFASTGDNGMGVSWPAVSANVMAVGGTTLSFNTNGTLYAETAWAGSGGGISLYVPMPTYQVAYGLTGTTRHVPDISGNADPASGWAIYDSTSYYGQKGWFNVGGTSASTPMWAAIHALSHTTSLSQIYTDAMAGYSSYFRDVTSGTNGTCGVVCTASAGYDTVTGLGSPITTTF